ncbi:hypothetical protein FMUND_8424 [Fusarium mundagurra]|uniref:Uncharacterized protein n=1 Tax=Fusarium mundagurra TaxID=1567541 RepID=A0A8H5YH41_9HYPO|nr:hypothetical protein FMUND_8424 [Fusarium mundagurra]
MPLLRIQYLRKDDHQNKPKPAPDTADTAVWHPVLGIGKSVQATTDESRTVPVISYETSTPFGKISINDISADIWAPAKYLLSNATSRIDSYKESRGIITLRKEETESLLKSGVFEGEQWRKSSSSQQLVKHLAPDRAVSGSLTFTAPIEALALMTQAPAFNALMVMVTIASMLGPIERDVSLIVAGALDGIFTEESEIGRPFLERSLERALLRAHQLAQSTRGHKMLDRFISDRLSDMPAPIHEHCAKTEEEVKGFGIDGSQLASIAEWAFNTTSRRPLLLWNKVEVLAAVSVSSLFNSRRLALVDCNANTFKRFDDRESSTSPRLAIFYRGNAQQAINILHQINWLQPVLAESKRAPSPYPFMRLSCPIEVALSACPAYLQTAGVSPENAASFINAVKKDAIAKFSRDVVLRSDELPGLSYTSEENLLYSYTYKMLGEPRNYDWDFWLGFKQPDIARIIMQQPSARTGVCLGSSTFYGYAGQAITKMGALGELHQEYMRKNEQKNYIQDSDVSVALAEVAGLIFAMALSAVHILDKEQMRGFKIGSGLGQGLRKVYSSLCDPSDFTVARHVCIGVLARVWLYVSNIIDFEDLPNTSLGISNSLGAVMSAIFGHTTSLFEATTKFIVSADVPDIIAGDKPVIACASTPMSKVQRRVHRVEVTGSKKSPYDGCWQISCLTITGGDPPVVSERMANRVMVVPVCGYIACGTRWWEYVDLNKAFTVMSADETDSPCTKCPLEGHGCWLEQENFLRRDGGGFTCALPPRNGGKVILPAYENGLMQSFLCGAFQGVANKLRWRYQQCIAHTDCDVLIV